jgi:hypothetical protein
MAISMAVGMVSFEKRYLPHDVAVISVGVSMQITHVKLFKVVGFSSGLVWALTASALCLCNISATETLSSERSISSILASGDVGSWLSVVDVPLLCRTRFAEGPGVTLLRFRRAGVGSGVVRST